MYQKTALSLFIRSKQFSFLLFVVSCRLTMIYLIYQKTALSLFIRSKQFSFLLFVVSCRLTMIYLIYQKTALSLFRRSKQFSFLLFVVRLSGQLGEVSFLLNKPFVWILANEVSNEMKMTILRTFLFFSKAIL